MTACGGCGIRRSASTTMPSPSTGHRRRAGAAAFEGAPGRRVAGMLDGDRRVAADRARPSADATSASASLVPAVTTTSSAAHATPRAWRRWSATSLAERGDAERRRRLRRDVERCGVPPRRAPRARVDARGRRPARQQVDARARVGPGAAAVDASRGREPGSAAGRAHDSRRFAASGSSDLRRAGARRPRPDVRARAPPRGSARPGASRGSPRRRAARTPRPPRCGRRRARPRAPASRARGRRDAGRRRGCRAAARRRAARRWAGRRRRSMTRIGPSTIPPDRSTGLVDVARTGLHGEPVCSRD